MQEIHIRLGFEARDLVFAPRPSSCDGDRVVKQEQARVLDGFTFDMSDEVRI
jgi:hypothetical protein